MTLMFGKVTIKRSWNEMWEGDGWKSIQRGWEVSCEEHGVFGLVLQRTLANRIAKGHFAIYPDCRNDPQVWREGAVSMTIRFVQHLYYWAWLAGWHLTYRRDMWRWRRGRGLRPRELPRHGGKAL